MIALIIYCGVVFGAAWGIGMSELSYPIRLLISGQFWPDEKTKHPFRQLIVTGLECPGCLSFHLGWFAFVSELSPKGVFNHWWEAALFSATSSLILARVTGLTDSAPPRGGVAHERIAGPGDESPTDG